MCVMCYATVMYIEFIPIFCERFIGDRRFPTLGRICEFVNRTSGKVMFIFIVLGVGISFLHQSSLGHIMVLGALETPSALVHSRAFPDVPRVGDCP